MSDQDEAGGGEKKGGMSTGTRVGLAAAIGLGALASGLLLTRPGRKLVVDVFRGGRRSTIESRVLDALWNDRVLGKRRIEVSEIAPGRVLLRGRVGSRDEVGRAVAVAEHAKGVTAVIEELEVGKKRG
jgi:hypothetical protein